MKTNLKKQKGEGNKVNNSHPMNQAPNRRMRPNKYAETPKYGRNHQRSVRFIQPLLVKNSSPILQIFLFNFFAVETYIFQLYTFDA